MKNASLSHRISNNISSATDAVLHTAEQKDGSSGSTRWVTAWGYCRGLTAVVLAPVWIPAIALRAAWNFRDMMRTTERVATDIERIAKGHNVPGARRVDGAIRLVITSDLHRSVAGRLNLPRRLNNDRIYEEVLAEYASQGWHLCENGDVEDFWVTGGSAYGSAYDLLRIVFALLRRIGITGPENHLYRSHLRSIIAENPEIYRTIATEFASNDRYMRTVGNHDDPLQREEVVAALAQVLPQARADNYIALTIDDRVAGIIFHGHQTDSWNAPGRANLGKLATWMARTLADIPQLQTEEGLASPKATETLIEGSARNGLIVIDPIFGANKRWDSLDEEMLYESTRRLGEQAPILLVGHTHAPVAAPRSRTGETWHNYFNSGSGVLHQCVTGLEWDGTVSPPTVRLVAWTMTEDGTVDRIAFDGGGERLRIASRAPLNQSVPVCPNPPEPRAVSSSESTS